MRLAKLNMPPELVARFSIATAGKAARFQQRLQQLPDPLGSYDDATQRQWLLLCLFGIAPDHIT
jgi:hypothetical protein